MRWNGNGSLKIASGKFIKKGKKLPLNFLNSLSETRKKYYIDEKLFLLDVEDIAVIVPDAPSLLKLKKVIEEKSVVKIKKNKKKKAIVEEKPTKKIKKKGSKKKGGKK